MQALSIFEYLGAAPCIAAVWMNQGIVQGILGREAEAEGYLSRSIGLFEELGALPEMAEAYVAKGQFLLGRGRLEEGGYYLERAGSLASSTDCRLLQIQLLQAKGELYARQGLHREAEISFEKALNGARLACCLQEESRSLALQGRLALDIKDYPRALRRLQKALAIASRIGAVYDVVCIYRDISRIFAAQGDGIRAGEMAELAARQEHLLSSDAIEKDEGEAQLVEKPLCPQNWICG
jgi:tetratricopeptide (TPR) repeat protein